MWPCFRDSCFLLAIKVMRCFVHKSGQGQIGLCLQKQFRTLGWSKTEVSNRTSQAQSKESTVKRRPIQTEHFKLNWSARRFFCKQKKLLDFTASEQLIKDLFLWYVGELDLVFCKIQDWTSLFRQKLDSLLRKPFDFFFLSFFTFLLFMISTLWATYQLGCPYSDNFIIQSLKSQLFRQGIF